ncbi:transcriptional regulator [Streptomyces genisteinicus]|uniref:Helix-turn-helix domain-containing protein n=1 Tax=Streptomyces genisteinicus TaxID=2768068 RepID=A0A7H0HVQ0_9ACTN|nr:transcriptional regulator [Streptomyces genisteinicus]QNP64616.1 helix-turn-helix domain-containing protein [Streptomyces genisteinicus]
MATTPEAEEFAAVLRRLKERSGQSYGALAGRLHVSTSTLHRYCNGDAVPAEFAVVERLARLCGAEREELLSLHRRWILADEARRRGREAARAADAAAADEAGPGHGPEGGRGSAAAAAAGPDPAWGAQARSGAPVEAAGLPSSAEAVPAPGPGTVPADAPGPGPTAVTGPAVTGPAVTGPGREAVGAAPGHGAAAAVPGPVAPGAGTGHRADGGGHLDGGGDGSGARGAGPGRTGETDEVSGPAGGDTVAAPDRPAPSARRKRLVVVLAAAAVVALAVPAAVVASRSGAPGDRAAAGATSAPAGGAAGSVPAASPPVSGSPSAQPSPGAAAGTPTPSPEGSAPAGNGAPAPAGAPLRVGVSSYNWDSPCGQYYLMGRAPAEIPPPPPPQDYRSWARALDGVDAGDLRLQLTATGKTRESVVITAVHVRITGRTEPLAWNAYSMGEGCGSGITPQTFDVDLDKPRPVLRPVAGQQGDITVPATDFPYKVASNDPQVFNLRLHTDSHDVRWHVEVDWSSGDRRGTLRIDDAGEPFRTSALAGRPLHEYRPDLGGVWKLREE